PGDNKCAGSEWLDIAYTAVAADDGESGAGWWHHHLIAHHPLPGLDGAYRLWCAAFDVRNSRNLSPIEPAGKVAVLGRIEPHSTNYRGLSVCLPGRGYCQLGNAVN